MTRPETIRQPFQSPPKLTILRIIQNAQDKIELFESLNTVELSLIILRDEIELFKVCFERGYYDYISEFPDDLILLSIKYIKPLIMRYLLDEYYEDCGDYNYSDYSKFSVHLLSFIESIKNKDMRKLVIYEYIDYYLNPLLEAIEKDDSDIKELFFDNCKSFSKTALSIIQDCMSAQEQLKLFGAFFKFDSNFQTVVNVQIINNDTVKSNFYNDIFIEQKLLDFFINNKVMTAKTIFNILLDWRTFSCEGKTKIYNLKNCYKKIQEVINTLINYEDMLGKNIVDAYLMKSSILNTEEKEYLEYFLHPVLLKQEYIKENAPFFADTQYLLTIYQNHVKSENELLSSSEYQDVDDNVILLGDS